jgi:hypothetical protein
MPKMIVSFIAMLFLALAASACATASVPAPTQTPSPTLQPTSLPSATLVSPTTPVLATPRNTPGITPGQAAGQAATFTPAINPTASDTLTPTQTPTPTRTPTKTPAYNLPGLHQVNLCGRTTYHYSDSRSLDLTGPYTLTMDLCVTTVLVNNDGSMKFNLEWRLITWDGPLPSRYMYASPDFMSLGDNLGNGYGRIGDSGPVVDNDVVGGKENTYIGWYLFPAPKDGATTFNLYDMVKKVTVPGIILWPGK